MRIRRSLPLLLVLGALTAPPAWLASEAASARAGAACSRVNQRSGTLVCTRVGRRLVWARPSATSTTGPNAVTTTGAPSTTAAAPSTTAAPVTAAPAVALPAQCRPPARNPARLATTGTVRAKVLFVDFADAPATETPQSLFALIADSPAFFSDVSYGRFRLVLEPNPTWLRMSKPSTAYSFATFASHKAYIEEAVRLADANVDFAGTSTVYVLAARNATAISYGPTLVPNAGDGITVDGISLTNAVTSGADLPGWGHKWLNHESLHSMGLPDLYDFTNPSGSAQGIHRHVGGFSVMGLISGAAPGPLAWERLWLGWLADDQVACHTTGTASYALSPISTVGGRKAVVVPTGPGRFVVVESRRATGTDAALPKPGALVYTVDLSVPSGSGPVRVVPAVANDPLRAQSPLAVGDTVTAGPVSVTVTAATAAGDTVTVALA